MSDSRLRIRFPNAIYVWGRPRSSGAEPGLYVGPDGFEGWDDGVTGRRDAVARPGSHGEFDLPVLKGARTIGIAGLALARTDYELGKLRSRVTGLGAAGGRHRIAVRHQGEELWAQARVIDVRFRDTGASGGWFRGAFAIDLICADPRKYGEMRSFYPEGQIGTLQARVFHYGNFPASPVVEVEGPRAAYTITGPSGRMITVGQALTSGQTHRIDLRTMQVYRNGVLQVGALVRAESWAIPPGTVVPMSISTGDMRVDVYDTYM